MSQSATAVLATRVVVVQANRKRKAPVVPPFLWKAFPGLKIAYAELVRDRAGRLQSSTGDTTPVFEEMGRLLEARFDAKAFFGHKGTQRLKQEYRNMKRVCGNFVSKHSISGNGRLATLPYKPSNQWSGRECLTVHIP